MLEPVKISLEALNLATLMPMELDFFSLHSHLNSPSSHSTHGLQMCMRGLPLHSQGICR